MPLPWQTPGGNTLPPRLVDLYLRIAIDGKDRCVSRQARRAGPTALFVGLSCGWRASQLYIDNGGCSLERSWSASQRWRLFRPAAVGVSLPGNVLRQITFSGVTHRFATV